jgi:biotin carboxylase
LTDLTLMLLGGSRYIVPVIEAARELQCKIVTCDYLPDNPAHQLADEYRNVSISDREAVLEVAKELEISGILSFAADPGVTTAAYVAEKLGLPFQADYETTRVLQNKNLFRAFLAEHSFATPWFERVNSVEQAQEVATKLSYPAIVKPTDSAGSKGVRKVEKSEEVVAAVEYALSFSLSGECLIEEFLEKEGDSSDADGFTVDGEFRCISFSGQMFDADSENPYVPSSYVLPAAMSEDAQSILVSELQRLAELLQLGSGTYNIETRVATNGVPYIMEISPRGGGNRLSEFLEYASGVDLISAAVKAALGLPVENLHMPVYDGVWFQELLRAEVPGRFEGLWFDQEFHENHVKNEQIWIESGDRVEAFTSANFAFGSIFMRFNDRAELDDYLQNPSAHMKILITPADVTVR